MATVGLTDESGSAGRAINNTSKALSITMTEDGSAGVTLHAYVEDSATGDSFQAVVVSDSDHQTVLAYSDIRTDVSTVGWYTFSGGTLASFSPANGTTYQIGILSNSAANAFFYNKDAGLVGWAMPGTATVGTPPSFSTPYDPDTAPRDYVIYMTYTPAGGGATVVVPTLIQNYRNMGYMR